MLKIRNILIVIGMLFCSVAFADVQVNIGISVPVYPNLVVVPGYPVYYAPQMDSNYFFYDGLYWVFQEGNWYESSWYNGPWWFVDPEDVPLFVLRIPVRYYRAPPSFFFGWSSASPPRWGDHWGHDWDQRRNGWDRWDQRTVYAPAPLPSYQRQYTGAHYPQQVDQQHELQKKSYRYEPRDPVVKQEYQKQEVQRSPARQVPPSQDKIQQEKQQAPQSRGARQQDIQLSAPNQTNVPTQQNKQETSRSQLPQKRGVEVSRSTPASPQQASPEAQAPRQQSQQRPDQGSQSRQKAGPEVQRPTPTSPQQGHQTAKDQMQQSQPRETQHEQKEPRSQDQNEKQRSNESPNMGNQGQGRDQGKDRNN